MEQKQLFSLEIKKGDYTFVFHMPSGASWGSALDAAFEVLNFVSTSAKQAAENSRPAEQKETIIPEIVEEA